MYILSLLLTKNFISVLNDEKKKEKKNVFFFTSIFAMVLFLGYFNFFLLLLLFRFTSSTSTTFYSKYFKTWMNEWNSMTFLRQQQQQQQWLHITANEVYRVLTYMYGHIHYTHSHIQLLQLLRNCDCKIQRWETRESVCVCERDERKKHRKTRNLILNLFNSFFLFISFLFVLLLWGKISDWLSCCDDDAMPLSSARLDSTHHLKRTTCLRLDYVHI